MNLGKKRRSNSQLSKLPQEQIVLSNSIIKRPQILSLLNEPADKAHISSGNIQNKQSVIDRNTERSVIEVKLNRKSSRNRDNIIEKYATIGSHRNENTKKMNSTFYIKKRGRKYNQTNKILNTTGKNFNSESRQNTTRKHSEIRKEGGCKQLEKVIPFSRCKTPLTTKCIKSPKTRISKKENNIGNNEAAVLNEVRINEVRDIINEEKSQGEEISQREVTPDKLGCSIRKVPPHIVIGGRKSIGEYFATFTRPKVFDLEEALNIGKYVPGGGPLAFRKYANDYMKKMKPLLVILNSRHHPDMFQLSSMEQELNYGSQGDQSHQILNKYLLHMEKRLGLISKPSMFSQIMDNMNRNQKNKQKILKFSQKYMQKIDNNNNREGKEIKEKRETENELPHDLFLERIPDGLFKSPESSCSSTPSNIFMSNTQNDIQNDERSSELVSIPSDEHRNADGKEPVVINIITDEEMLTTKPQIEDEGKSPGEGRETSEIYIHKNIIPQKPPLDLKGNISTELDMCTKIGNQKEKIASYTARNNSSSPFRDNNYYAKNNVLERLQAINNLKRSKNTFGLYPQMKLLPLQRKYIKEKRGLMRKYDTMMNSDLDNMNSDRQKTAHNINFLESIFCDSKYFQETINEDQYEKLTDLLCSHYGAENIQKNVLGRETGEERRKRLRGTEISCRNINKHLTSSPEKDRKFHIERKGICTQDEMQLYHEYVNKALENFSDPYIRDKYRLYQNYAKLYQDNEDMEISPNEVEEMMDAIKIGHSRSKTIIDNKITNLQKKLGKTGENWFARARSKSVAK